MTLECSPAQVHPRLQQTLDGLEKYCARCNEWWPADKEFFFKDPAGLAGLFYCCKACYREMQVAGDYRKTGNP